MRNVFAEIRDIVVTSVLLFVFFAVVGYPETVGRWLQAIDTARYEVIDCDCTEPLE